MLTRYPWVNPMRVSWHKMILKSLSLFPGLSGSRNRGHHEKGTSDGWSRRWRAEVHLKNLKHKLIWYNLIFIPKFGTCSCLTRLQPKRVFQTVKNLNLMRQQRSSLAPSPLNIPGSNQTSCLTSGRSSRICTPRANSMYGSETGSGIILDNRTSCILGSPNDGYEGYEKSYPKIWMFSVLSLFFVFVSGNFINYLNLFLYFLVVYVFYGLS